jgi:molecular chaperone GrpE
MAISLLFAPKKIRMSSKKENEENINEENLSKESISEEKNETTTDTINWEEKFNEMQDKYLRLYSEFDNFRKRSIKEKVDYIGQASADIIKELLPILDDLDRAFTSNEASSEGFYEGISLIRSKLHKTLEDKGLKAIESSGQVFDVELHEAITNFPAEKEEDKGKVINTIEKGYYLKDKVLRFAKVVVGQ